MLNSTHFFTTNANNNYSCYNDSNTNSNNNYFNLIIYVLQQHYHLSITLVHNMPILILLCMFCHVITLSLYSYLMN